MLIALPRGDGSGDILLAADGCLAVGDHSTQEWREEASYEVKSVRLSKTCAIALSAGSVRFVNHFLAHVFREPSWRELEDSATSIIMANEEAFLRPGLQAREAEREMSEFVLPRPAKEERGTGLTAIVAGVYDGGVPAVRQWRYAFGSACKDTRQLSVLYTLYDESHGPGIVSRLLASKDTEACVAEAFKFGAEVYPGRVNANVGLRCLHEEFRFRWLSNSQEPDPSASPSHADADT